MTDRKQKTEIDTDQGEKREDGGLCWEEKVAVFVLGYSVSHTTVALTSVYSCAV